MDNQNLPSIDSERKHYLIFLLLFIIGAIGFITFRLWLVKNEGRIFFVPQQSSFVFKLPSDALKSEVSLSKGDFKKKPRDKEEFKEVNVGAEILQGERIATGNKSQATVEFENILRINLGPNTEIGFNNLIPANFLLSQLSGSVTYELLQNNIPISIRILHTLVTINSGKSDIAINDTTITVKTLSGNVKLALVDLENKTNIWEIKEGQEALVNDAQGGVEIK